METSIISIKRLISEELCYETIRQLRWSGRIYCPHCDSESIIKRGRKASKLRVAVMNGKRFDDLTGTVLAGHHQPLPTWILCLYFMGLNLSNTQITQELDLNKDDLQEMTEYLREGVDKKKSR